MINIVNLAKEIETSRTDIIKKYGVEDENGEISVPDDKVEIATTELNDLFSLTQDVSINMLKLDWFDDLELSSDQVKAISFMIEE